MAVYKDILAGFYTAYKGMLVTGREMFRPAITLQYPYEKRPLPDRFRGTLVNDAEICIACNKCVKICPVDCIVCVGEGKGKNRHPSLFTIDYVKCCWCALCVDSCPVDSLYMSKEYEMVFRDRSKMFRDFVSDPIPPIGGKRKPEDKESAKDDKASDTKAEPKADASKKPEPKPKTEAKPKDPKKEQTDSGRAAA